MKKYILTEYQLRILVSARMRYQAIQDGGVDNWEWIDECEFPEDEDIEQEMSRYESEEQK